MTRTALRRCGGIALAALLSVVAAPGWAQNAPKYSADVPSKITTPATVQTRIGTLTFQNGAPDAKTVQLVYDQLDFSRGIEAFRTGISATSVYAICEGLAHAGIKRNHGIGITEELLDARSLFLTPNTTTVYVFMASISRTARWSSTSHPVSSVRWTTPIFAG